MSIIAVIPARGGSKRIPRKNIRPFLGKPVIAYSISAAQQAGIFDDIIVSTDDKEIAAVAEQYGASVPFLRPSDIADDQTGIIEVVAHTIRELGKQDKYPSVICTIYATAPLIQDTDIINAHEKLCSSDKDFVFTAVTFPSPIFRAFSMQRNESVKMFWPENYQTNSQDLPEAYHDAGQFFWGKREAYLRKSPQLFSENSLALLIPRYRAIDIDTMEDWQQAELLYKILQAKT